jgi:hypothetical protein
LSRGGLAVVQTNEITGLSPSFRIPDETGREKKAGFRAILSSR